MPSAGNVNANNIFKNLYLVKVSKCYHTATCIYNLLTLLSSIYTHTPGPYSRNSHIDIGFIFRKRENIITNESKIILVVLIAGVTYFGARFKVHVHLNQVKQNGTYFCCTR